jgi:hypothetical protein
VSADDEQDEHDGLRPVPETDAALQELERYADDASLREELLARGAAVRALVPECVGMSVAVHEDRLTFTLVATDADIAGHDAVQYLDGGPCVDAAEDDAVRACTVEELLDEDRWRLFAQATAADGVRSTLTLPLRSVDRVVGSINLYAATADAFDGQHEEVAAVFGAWPVEAVTNADLGFLTRRSAGLAPAVARDQVVLSLAVGLVAERARIGVDDARRRVREAAERAGVDEATFARYLVEALEDPPDDPLDDAPDDAT